MTAEERFRRDAWFAARVKTVSDELDATPFGSLYIAEVLHANDQFMSGAIVERNAAAVRELELLEGSVAFRGTGI